MLEYLTNDNFMKLGLKIYVTDIVYVSILFYFIFRFFDFVNSGCESYFAHEFSIIFRVQFLLLLLLLLVALVLLMIHKGCCFRFFLACIPAAIVKNCLKFSIYVLRFINNFRQLFLLLYKIFLLCSFFLAMYDASCWCYLLAGIMGKLSRCTKF